MRIAFLLISLLLCIAGQGQYFATEKKLIDKIEKAPSKAEQVTAMEELAEFYYIYKSGKKGDSLLQASLTVAEMANDKDLILNVFFGNALNAVTSWSSKETFERALSFAEKGIKHARETGNKDLEALAYVRKAALYRKKNAFDEALKEASLAQSSAVGSTNDSLQISILLEIGKNHLAKADYLSAYKNFNNAFDYAYQVGNLPLQSESYHCFADLYWSFDKDLAKINLLKSAELNMQSGNNEKLLEDYIDLYRLTETKEYLKEVEKLAKTTTSEYQKYFTKRLVFSSLMVVDKNADSCLRFLNENEGLRQALINPGMGNYFFNIGHIYFYADRADSAIHYYQLAEPELTTSFDPGVTASFYHQMGRGYSLAKDYEKAVIYYKKALEFFEKKDFNASKYISDSLRRIYVRAGDYKQAYEFTMRYNYFNDSLQKLEKQRDFVYLEFEREKKKYEKDLADIKSAEIRTRNLQYMGISLATAAFFIVLILIGMFPTSRFSMKMLSFFAFICLFEFIILLIDTWLHNLTHGEPLKIWLAKVGIIAILLPLHHYLDHLSFQFLSSHKLEKLRQQFSVKRIISKIKVVEPSPTVHETETKEKKEIVG